MSHAHVHAFMSACIVRAGSAAEAPELRALCRWTTGRGISGKSSGGAALLLALPQPRRVQPVKMRTAWPVPFYTHKHKHFIHTHKHKHTHTHTHNLPKHTRTQKFTERERERERKENQPTHTHTERERERERE